MGRCRICLLALVLGAPTGAGATTWYVASTGVDDAGQGTSPQTPLQTISYALTRVQANDTVSLDDGAYGDLTAPCTVDTPSVKIRAAHERLASVDSLRLGACHGWEIAGLKIVAPVDGGVPVVVLETASSDIVLRRNLVIGNAGASPLVSVSGARQLLEENEVLRYAGVAIGVFSSATELRRNYLSTSALTGSSGTPAGTAIEVVSDSCLLENNLIEGGSVGIRVGPGVTVGTALFGNLVRGSQVGVRVFAGAPPAMHGDVVIGATLSGINLLPDTAVSLDHVTLDVSNGEIVTVATTPAGALTMTDSDLHSALELLHGSVASLSLAGSQWSTDGGADAPPFVPPVSVGLVALAHVDARRFGCWAYPPGFWPWQSADGGAVGASVRNRVEGGLLTAEPLWALDAGGRFPCGATLPENDTPGASCIDAHQRFGVNLPDCPLVAPPPAPGFVSVPPADAQCGAAYRYQARVDSAEPVTYSLRSDDGFTVDAHGLVAWEVPARGVGRAVVTATTPEGAISQQVEVTVDCPPPPSCGCTHSGAAGLVIAALALFSTSCRVRRRGCSARA